MTITQIIIQHLESLPDTAQQEVLHFVEFLESRQKCFPLREENTAWSDFSLSSAMRGMEDEETPYTLADIEESFS